MAAPHFGYHDPLGWGEIYMLDSFLVSVIIGTLLGFLAGLGVGGGSILMLWLTLLLKLPHSVSRSINLLFFIPTALISSIFRFRKSEQKFTDILPAIFLGAGAAALTSLISRQLDLFLVKKGFGILLLITGIREILYRPRNRK